MADKEEAAVSVAGDEMVDEAVERLLEKADASGAALLGEGGLLTEITKAVLERALKAEMSEHLGYERGDPAGHGSGNSRNGTSPKTVLTDAGAVTLAVPRDRNGEMDGTQLGGTPRVGLSAGQLGGVGEPARAGLSRWSLGGGEVFEGLALLAAARRASGGRCGA